MLDRHVAYAIEDTGVGVRRFNGTREELKPGAFLGYSARPDLMVAGDVITAEDLLFTWGDYERSKYFYDPELRIAEAVKDSSSFVRSQSGQWLTIRRSW